MKCPECGTAMVDRWYMEQVRWKCPKCHGPEQPCSQEKNLAPSAEFAGSDATDLWNKAVIECETVSETNACWGVLRELQRRGCITLKEDELQPMAIGL